MIIIGINEGINSSVVVLRDGELVFALQEERLNRQKEFTGFPHESLRFAFSYLGLDPSQVDTVCLSNLISPTFTREEFQSGYDRGDKTALQNIFQGGYPVLRQQVIAKTIGRFPELLEQRSKNGHSRSNQIVQGYLHEHGLAQAK